MTSRAIFGWALAVLASTVMTGCPQLLEDAYDLKATTTGGVETGGAETGGTNAGGTNAGGTNAGAGSGDEPTTSGSATPTGNVLGGAGAASGSAGTSLTPPGGSAGTAAAGGTGATTGSGGEGGAGGGTGGFGGAAGSAGASGSGGEGGVGGNAGAGGSAGGSGGTGGAGGTTSRPLHDCTNETSLASALLVDFETLDEAAPAAGQRFVFGTGATAPLGELAAYDDRSGDYALEVLSGPIAGLYPSATNAAASDWGGGVQLFLDCVDASSFTGLRFLTRGDTPAGTVEVGLTLGNGDSVGYEFDITGSWTTQSVEFPDFEGTGDTTGAVTDGSGITTVTFASQLVYSRSTSPPYDWVAEPGAFTVSIDDLEFY